jgi:hypothetical protein
LVSEPENSFEEGQTPPSVAAHEAPKTFGQAKIEGVCRMRKAL